MPMSHRRRLRRHRVHTSRPSRSGTLNGIRMLWGLRVVAAALPQDVSDSMDQLLNSDLLEGLGIHLDDEERDLDERALEPAVQERLQIFESDAPRLRDHPIAQNVRILGEPLGLNGTEREILELLTINASNRAFAMLLSEVREACDCPRRGCWRLPCSGPNARSGPSSPPARPWSVPVLSSWTRAAR